MNDSKFRPIVIPKETVDAILTTEYPMEVLGLYSFYYYTCVWQETNQCFATLKYCKGASKGWSEKKVSCIRKILKGLDLIKDVQDNKGGTYGTAYVAVNWCLSAKTLDKYGLNRAVDSRVLDKVPSKCLNNNTKILSRQKIAEGGLLGGKPVVNVYVELARELHRVILTRYKTVVKVNHSHWANELRLLHTKDEQPLNLIHDVLEWLEANIFDKYTPHVLSAGSFREKFCRIVVKMEDSNPFKAEPTEQDKEQAYRVMNHFDAPNVKSKYLASCIALSNSRFLPFRKSFEEFFLTLRISSTKRIAAEYLMGTYFNSDHMTVWYARAGGEVKGWAGWSGNLDYWSWEIDSPRVERYLDAILEDYCGHSLWGEMVSAYKVWESDR